MSATAVPETTKTSVWEDFLDIFYAPSQVFARRENGSFGLALAVLTIGMLALYFGTRPVLEPVFEAEINRQIAASMQQNPQITPEVAEQMRGFGSIMAPIMIGIGTPITVLLIGVVLWLVGKMFDAQQTLRSAFVVATYAYFPRLLEQVVNAIQGALMGPEALTGLASISIGPARFFDPDATSPELMVLLLRVSLFTLWVTVLLAIGLKITGKISMAKAAAAAAIVWVLGALPQLMGALRQ